MYAQLESSWIIVYIHTLTHILYTLCSEATICTKMEKHRKLSTIEDCEDGIYRNGKIDLFDERQYNKYFNKRLEIFYGVFAKNGQKVNC